MPDERAPEYDDDGPQGEPVERLAGLVVAGPVVGGQETAVLGRQEDLEVGLTLTQVSFVQNFPVLYFTKNTHYFVKFVLLAKLALSGGKKTRKRNKTKNGTKLEKGTKFEKVQNFEKKFKK